MLHLLYADPKAAGHFVLLYSWNPSTLYSYSLTGQTHYFFLWADRKICLDGMTSFLCHDIMRLSHYMYTLNLCIVSAEHSWQKRSPELERIRLAHIERCCHTSASGCCVCWYQEARPYSDVLVQATTEAAMPRLVMYIVNIELGSAATITKEPIYGPYMAKVQKSRLIWMDQSDLNVLDSCIWHGKLSIVSRCIFPRAPSHQAHRKKTGLQDYYS